MKFIDKLISFIFSLAIIVLSVVVLLVMTNLIEYSVIEAILKEYVFNIEYSKTIILTSIIVLLLGLKVTVFSSSSSSKARKNLIVDTPHGKIQIAQDTIEGVAKSVIKDYEQIKDVQARMVKAGKGINMYMVLLVYQNINIKEVVTSVQDDVKRQIEDTTSIKVRNVDVRIKNIVSVSATPSIKRDNVVNTNSVVANEEIKAPEVLIQNVEIENVAEEKLVDSIINETENKATESNINNEELVNKE